jgi:tetratricopeptide (TPR) repeat protein
LFEQVADRAEQQQSDEPKNANAFYWHAYALGRYAQGISIAKALAAGIGGRVKASLETAVKLAPKHADAHIGLGTYHAEIIDKVGAMVGGLTYGAKKDTGLKHFETALKLNPDSAIARIEMANGLVMLDGKKALAKAEALYSEAAACEPMDAMERLDVELARAELED